MHVLPSAREAVCPEFFFLQNVRENIKMREKMSTLLLQFWTLQGKFAFSNF